MPQTKIEARVSDRLDSALNESESDLVVDLGDPAVKRLVRCRALLYSARYLRSIHVDEAADLLEDRAADMCDDPVDKTVVDLIDLTVPRRPTREFVSPSGRVGGALVDAEDDFFNDDEGITVVYGEELS